MKKIIISSALLTLFACNEKKIAASEVPAPVTAAFAAKYPNSSDVKWEQEKKDDGKWIYEAEFKTNGKEIEAEFDSTGNFIKEE
jgi:hypothetical protein